MTFKQDLPDPACAPGTPAPICESPHLMVRLCSLSSMTSTSSPCLARIRLHEGKTRIWNAAGEEPPAVADLGGDAHEPVWVGDWSLPPVRQGLTVLGSLLGHDLQSKRAKHDRLLQRILHLDDLQAAWLLPQSCAAPRANYLLRILPPHLTAAYATDHDSAVAQCLANLLELEAPLTPSTVRELPQRFGGLGLICASSDRYASTAWCRHGASRLAPFSKASWHRRVNSGARARITGSASAIKLLGRCVVLIASRANPAPPAMWRWARHGAHRQGGTSQASLQRFPDSFVVRSGVPS